MKRFCVFTPTYNRAYTLPRLFESLEAQECKDFVWHITDDGSTDNTPEVVQGFIDKGTVEIRFDRCENGGKTRAVVRAAAQAREELFLVADSDDWFTPDAIAVFSSTWDECKGDPHIAGMISLRGHDDGTAMDRMPEGVSQTNSWDLYTRYHFASDCLHVYRTRIFNMYPAPVVDSEKFISEGWTINHIAQEYDVRLIDQVLYLGDYLSDGLSKSVRKLTKDNPIGYYKTKEFYYEMSKTLGEKVENLALYLVGAKLAGKEHPVLSAPNKVLAAVLYPAVLLLVRFEYK